MRPTDGCSFATMAPEHIPFVTSSWRGSGMGQTTLKRVITRPDARAVVAHVSGYPDQYIGWAASLRGVLVYVYVRGFLRKNGFGGLLIASVVPNAVPIHVACNMSQKPVLYWRN